MVKKKALKSMRRTYCRLKFGKGSFMLWGCVAYTGTGITEYAWIDLKQALYTQKPRNLTELEEWAKNPPARLQGLVCGYAVQWLGVCRLFYQQKEALLNNIHY